MGAFSPIHIIGTANTYSNVYAPDPTNTYPTHVYPIHSDRRTSPAPRIPTPAALRSSSPLGLSVLSGDTGSTSTFAPGRGNAFLPNLRPSSPSDTHNSSSPSRLALLRSPSSSGLPRLPSLSMHVWAESESGHVPVQESTEFALHQSVAEPESVGRAGRGSQSGPLDLGWLTQQLDQALPPPHSLELLPPNTYAPSSQPHNAPETSRPPLPRPSSDSGADIDRPSTGSVRRPFRALPLMRRLHSPEPSLGSTREFMSSTGASFGSSSVDSAFPASTVGQRRPLPWVDLEHEGVGGMSGSSSSGMGGSTYGVMDSTLSVMGNERPGAEHERSRLQLSGSAASRSHGPGLPIAAGPVSREFGGMPSPVGMESVASTVQSDDGSSSPFTGDLDATVHVTEGTNTHTEGDVTGGHSAGATFGSPSTSGSSASARTTPSGFTRQPPPLSLRGFPTSPTFSASSFAMSGPVSASPSSFIVAESPIFPTSASPRTSTFDLGVTPPGSALPSFVARMMEVDSPVRESAGGDVIGHAYTIPELVLEPQGENGSASIDALRRFTQTTGEDSLARSPNQTLGDEPMVSYFAGQPAPLIRREPIRFALGALGAGDMTSSPTEELSAQTLRRFDAANHYDNATTSSDVLATGPVPSFPPLREASEIAQQGSSAFSSSARTNSTPHQLEDSDPVWPARLSDLGSVYSQRLTESGVTYPSRPSESGASLPSFRASVSPGPELNMGSRPGRLVRDTSWSFSDLFGPGREGSGEGMSASGSETSLRPRVGHAVSGERQEGTGRSSRAGVRSALNRAVGLAGSARGSESLPRLQLNALPRVSGAEPSRRPAGQDERSQAWSGAAASTNLSRTPPGAGSNEHTVPSFAEAWLEESTGAGLRSRSFSSRRMSDARWIDVFAESSSQPVAAPTEPRSSNRPRMPPAIPISSADSTLFDPLSSMSWDRGSHTSPVPFVDLQQVENEIRQQPTQDTAASLTRYQTFAQSIDELRRSPPLQQPPPTMSSAPRYGGTGLRLPPVVAPSINSSAPMTLDTARAESTGLSETPAWYNGGSDTTARPPWATPRHEPLPMLSEPQRTRNPYSLGDDVRRTWAPTGQEPSREPPAQTSEHSGNWLREWERERDRLSRLTREQYMRRRETETSSSTSTSAVPGTSEPRGRAALGLRSLTQLSDTQAQGQMWDEYNARHEPRPWPQMTRASLEATGFADDDLSNDNANSAQLWGSMPRHPSRRPETLPPRVVDDTPVPFPLETTPRAVPDIPFTESPPSSVQEFIGLTRQNQYDSFSSDVFQSFQRTNSQRPQPEHNPADFRHATQALRRSLDTSRRNSRERDSSLRTGPSQSPVARRWLGLGDPSTLPSQSSSNGQPERARLPSSRDRWDAQYRSQSQFDRVRQLLHSQIGKPQGVIYQISTTHLRLSSKGAAICQPLKQNPPLQRSLQIRMAPHIGHPHFSGLGTTRQIILGPSRGDLCHCATTPAGPLQKSHHEPTLRTSYSEQLPGLNPGSITSIGNCPLSPMRVVGILTA
ncbi:hypothetical protein BDV93DRAFT_178150 [Ceratobasidium sp. AG-I]|nr:hypothetical protein BDV93DRAFT_178150 [Ceratobasidium sp. AG-I]